MVINQFSERIKKLLSAKHETMAAFAKSEDKLRETNLKLQEAEVSVANMENVKKELMDQVQISEQCCDRLMASKQSSEVEMEHHRMTLKSLRQELVSLQAQLKETEEAAVHDKESYTSDIEALDKTVEMVKKDCFSLQEKIKQYELKEAAWKDKSLQMEGESVSVKSSIITLQRKLDMANREKENLIEVHHVRLEQLKESYQEKLDSAKVLHEQHEVNLEAEATRSRQECLQLKNELQKAKTVY
jgi:chromosome segregation ATPase